MILKALYEYYQTLADDPESGISQSGFSKEQVSFALIINKKGKLKGLMDLRNEKKNRIMDVPQHNPPRASNILAYFLCDNSKYFLGIGANKQKKKLILETKKFDASKELHLKMLDEIKDENAEAVKAYFKNNNPKELIKLDFIKEKESDLIKSSNLVFAVEGEKKFVHELAKIRKLTKTTNNENGEEDAQIIKGQCAVTGLETEIPNIHGKIKGVKGTKQLRGSIVSFNDEAYKSFGKEQNFNASIGKEVSFAYVTALNYMLEYSSIQNMQIGDATTVFWAEKYGPGQEELFYALFNPTDVEEKKESEEKGKKKNIEQEKELKKTRLNDPGTVARMRDFLGRVAQGKGVKEFKGYDEDVKFYVLGLSPNAARISVRFFYADTFGRIVEKIKSHYDDMLIEKQYKNESDAIAVWQLLRETAAQGKSENIQPAFSGALTKAILTGGAYPAAVYQAVISRMGIDKTINRNRAAFIKAYIERKNRINGKEGGVTVSLNTEEIDVGYRLGRLFAMLEKAQTDASPGINATIKDRYFGTASASPKAIFPILMRLSQHHIAGAKYGKFTDKQIEEIVGELKTFPAHLNLDEQGMFMLGYYHQRNALYKKKEEK
jgi:CRISPR-associated protein Csd1